MLEGPEESTAGGFDRNLWQSYVFAMRRVQYMASEYAKLQRTRSEPGVLDFYAQEARDSMREAEILHAELTKDDRGSVPPPIFDMNLHV